MSSPAYRANFALIDWSGMKPRQRRPRGPVQRSGLPCPMLVRAFAEPVQSMADGRWYDTPRDLERTYRPSGNPRGEEFIPLGNETPKASEYEPDPIERRNDLRQAMRDVETGNLPPEIRDIQ